MKFRNKHTFEIQQKLTQKAEPSVKDLTEDVEKLTINKSVVETGLKPLTRGKVEPSVQIGNGKSIFQIVTDLNELSETGELDELQSTINFILKDFGNYNFFIEIYDEQLSKILYKKQMNAEFNYFVDPDQKLFKWSDSDPS